VTNEHGSLIERAAQGLRREHHYTDVANRSLWESTTRGTASKSPGGLGRIAIRSHRSPTVDARADQPASTSARRIDEREPWSGCVEQTGAASWEGESKDIAVRGYGAIDLVAGKEEKPRCRQLNAPAFATGDRGGHPLVPTDLPLDRTHVVEARLDLDDDEATGSRVERQEVDPSMRPTVDDFDLAQREPTIGAKSSVHIAGAPGVDELALSLTEDDRRGSDDPQFEPEGVPDPLHDVERRVRGPRFDRGDISRGQPHHPRELALTQAECRPGGTTETTERHAEWLLHIVITARAT
jgi:hypothetical protein